MMTPFDYKYQNSSGLAFLMLIKAIRELKHARV